MRVGSSREGARLRTVMLSVSIAASVPLSEMFGYSTKLRSMSQGRAVYSMEFSHYEEVPKSKADEIINKVKA